MPAHRVESNDDPLLPRERYISDARLGRALARVRAARMAFALVRKQAACAVGLELHAFVRLRVTDVRLLAELTRTALTRPINERHARVCRRARVIGRAVRMCPAVFAFQMNALADVVRGACLSVFAACVRARLAGARKPCTRASHARQSDVALVRRRAFGSFGQEGLTHAGVTPTFRTIRVATALADSSTSRRRIARAHTEATRFVARNAFAPTFTGDAFLSPSACSTVMKRAAENRKTVALFVFSGRRITGEAVKPANTLVRNGVDELGPSGIHHRSKVGMHERRKQCDAFVHRAQEPATHAPTAVCIATFRGVLI